MNDQQTELEELQDELRNSLITNDARPGSIDPQYISELRRTIAALKGE